MKRRELKQLIRESVKSALNENFLTESPKDPTKEEMVQFLTQQFGGMTDQDSAFRFDMEGAIYWFASHYHGGQWSNLYSALSTSQFRPGPSVNGPEKDSMEEDMYKALEAEYGGQEHQHGTEFDDANRREVDSMTKEPPHPGEGDDWRDALQETGKETVLKYIDNNYYILSPKQAKEFAVDGKLPRPGYEKKADISKLKGLKADIHGRIQPLDISDEDSAWILPTVTWGKQVWAVRIHKRNLPIMREDGAAAGGQGGPGAPGTGMGNVTANVDPVRTPYAFSKKGKHPKDLPAHRTNEGTSEDDDALYVEYLSQMPGEEPFMLNGQKFEYVWAKYPSGKKDIGVYAFAGDMTYGYQAFRQMHNLKEEEMVDPTTGEVAPGPRDRFEDEESPRNAEPPKVNEGRPQTTEVDWVCPHCRQETHIPVDIESPSDYVASNECEHCGKEINDPKLDDKVMQSVQDYLTGRAEYMRDTNSFREGDEADSLSDQDQELQAERDWETISREREKKERGVTKGQITKALGKIGLMSSQQWNGLVNRARKSHRFFPSDGSDPVKLNAQLALQYISEHPDEFKTEPSHETMVPETILKLKDLIK